MSKGDRDRERERGKEFHEEQREGERILCRLCTDSEEPEEGIKLTQVRLQLTNDAMVT